MGRATFTAALLLASLGGGAAHATTLLAPAGGVAVPLGPHRVACPGGGELRGWRIESGGSHLRPPATVDPAGTVATVRVATRAASCASGGRPLHLVATAAVWPTVDPAHVQVHVDAGRVELRGRALAGALLRWRGGGRAGSDACRDPKSEGGVDSCVLRIAPGLPADPTALALRLLPPGTPDDDDVIAFDGRGQAVDLGARAFAPARLVVDRLVAPDAVVDALGDGGNVELVHPEATATVFCAWASCTLEGDHVVVHGEHGGEDQMEMRLSLRPHVFAQSPSGLREQATVLVPLQRCPLALASAPPLRGVPGQRVVLRLGGRCARDPDLRFLVAGAVSRPESRVAAGDAQLVVLPVSRAWADEFTIVAQHGGSTAALVRVRPQALPAHRARLELANLAEIDFLPTNRPVRVALPPLPAGGELLAEGVAGVYDVGDAAGARGRGIAEVRAVAEARGQIALRLVFRDPRLPGDLAALKLAEFDDNVERTLKPANVPVALGGGEEALAEMICGDRGGNERVLAPGANHRIPFVAKDSCRVVLHQERLGSEDGEQKVRLLVTISGLDGLPRPETTVDQVITMRPQAAPRPIYVSGATKPFDRVLVRLTPLGDDPHYAVRSDEQVAAPPLQWSLTMGDNRLRLAATVSFPTGLFRVAEREHSGILGLNSGIVLRLQALDARGIPWPLALEVGTLWMGIAADQTNSRLGQAAVVAGVGVGVPIANVGRATQATISLHAWAEYEVSRALLGQAGRPWGFVFGPSLFIGDIGINI